MLHIKTKLDGLGNGLAVIGLMAARFIQPRRNPDDGHNARRRLITTIDKASFAELLGLFCHTPHAETENYSIFSLIPIYNNRTPDQPGGVPVVLKIPKSGNRVCLGYVLKIQQEFSSTGHGTVSIYAYSTDKEPTRFVRFSRIARPYLFDKMPFLAICWAHGAGCFCITIDKF